MFAARLRKTDTTPDAAPIMINAPVGGWWYGVTAGKADTALILENFFPTTQGVKVRGGKAKVATVGARARSMFTYKTGAVEKLFATTGTAIYDISALNPNAVPSASVSSLTSGNYYASQIATPGGEYLMAVNGADAAKLFDGTTWTNASITGVTTSLLSYVWIHKNRYWFVEKNSRRAWYLPVDSIAGAAVSITMDGIFQRGGTLLFGATWSEDAGDGMDDRAVFVSSEGEVAVFQGADPSSASTWAQVGLYLIPKPMGPKCHMRAGGDLLIGTASGLVPLSAITTKDPAALDVASVSRAIDTPWRRSAATFDDSQPWEIVKWPTENMMLVTLPHDGVNCFVANLQTGAWCKYVGWDVQCAALFGGKMYFGEKTGKIYAAESGGNDDGASYTARLTCTPNDLGNATSFKTVGAVRGVFFAADTLLVQMSMGGEYTPSFSGFPTIYAPSTNGAALWDVALWDGAKWDDDGTGNYLAPPVASTGWVSVGANGYFVTPQVQIVVNGAGKPTVELISIELAAESGGSVV